MGGGEPPFGSLNLTKIGQQVAHWKVGGGWWVVDGVPLFGSLNLLIII